MSGGPQAGLRRAVVSASANCREVLVAAGIDELFEVRIDGVVAEREQLRGKPAPDTFLAAAAEARRRPSEAAVFEDALAGVAAGRAGRFGLVVGVDRVGQAEALREHGADVVVATSPSCSSAHDRAPRLRGRALVGARDARSISTCSRRRSRCSRSRTATSDCAATSTKASRSECPGRT